MVLVAPPKKNPSLPEGNDALVCVCVCMHTCVHVYVYEGMDEGVFFLSAFRWFHMNGLSKHLAWSSPQATPWCLAGFR